MLSDLVPRVRHRGLGRLPTSPDSPLRAWPLIMALQASSPTVILPQVLPAVVLSTYPNSELSFPCLVAKMTFESSLVMAELTQSTCGFLRANLDCALGWGRPAGHGAGAGLGWGWGGAGTQSSSDLPPCSALGSPPAPCFCRHPGIPSKCRSPLGSEDVKRVL